MADETILKCRCGKKKTIPHKVTNMGGVMDAGWGVVSTFDGKLNQTCPECYKELRELAERITEITGEKYVSISGLLRDR